MHFASLLSGGFITAIVVNPPESKLAKRTSVDSFEKKKNSLPHFRAKNPRPTINLKLSLESKASVSEQGLVYRHFDSFLISYALFVPEYRPFIIHVSKFAVEEIIFNTPGSGKDF